MRGAVVRVLVALVCLAVTLASLAAEPTPAQRDRNAVAHVRANGECRVLPHVVVCVERDALTPQQHQAFARMAEDGAVAIRTYLGEHLDLPGGNHRRVEYFIGPNVGPPHVTINHEPWVFMHPETVQKHMAPYLHETVHAMAQWSWRRSEWTAEGFANYVASAVVSRTKGGYHRSFILADGLNGLDRYYRSEEGQAMRPLVGARGRRGSYAPEHAALFAQLMADRRRYAPPFYAMSWSFVAHVIDRAGIAGLKAIATADDPEAAARDATGVTLQQLKQRWEAGFASPARGG